MYRKRVFEVSQDATRQTRGTPIQNLIEAINPTEETVTAVVAISNPDDDKYIFMATRKGQVKKMELNQFANIRKSGLAAFDLEKEDGDSLLTARLADSGMTAILITRNGQGVQFGLTDKDVRTRKGRSAGGVRGIRLIEGDEVVAMDVAWPESPTSHPQFTRLRQADCGGEVPGNGPRRAGRHRDENHGQDGPHRRSCRHRTGRGRDHGRLSEGDRLPHRHQGDPEPRAQHAGRAGDDQAGPDDEVISMSAFRERTWEDFEEAAAEDLLKLPAVKPKKASSNGDKKNGVGTPEATPPPITQITMDLPLDENLVGEIDDDGGIVNETGDDDDIVNETGDDEDETD